MSIVQYINWYLVIYYHVIYFNTLMVFLDGFDFLFDENIKIYSIGFEVAINILFISKHYRNI